MFIKTYQKYLIKQFSFDVLKISSIFFCLAIILNIFEEINYLKEVKISFTFPLILTLLNTPSVLFEIFPFIFLISAQFFFLRLIDMRELGIYKSFGLSNLKILSTVTIFSLFLGIVIAVVFYSFSAKLKFTYLSLKNNFSNDNKYLAVVTENGLWIKDEIDNKINIINGQSIVVNNLTDISITQFNNEFILIQSIKAKEANISKKTWVLKDVMIATNKVQTEKLDEMKFESNFDIDKIKNLFSNLSSLTVFELNKLKKDYKELGYSTIEISVHQQKILSFPVYLMAMSLFSSIIMLNIKHNKPKIFHLLLGIMLSVVVYYINYFSTILAQNEKIPIILSAWLPLIILLIISSIGLVRINEK